MGIIYEIRPRGRAKNERYELWRSFDFADGSPVRLEVLDVFDNYMAASQRRALELKEEERRGSSSHPHQQ